MQKQNLILGGLGMVLIITFVVILIASQQGNPYPVQVQVQTHGQGQEQGQEQKQEQRQEQGQGQEQEQEQGQEQRQEQGQEQRQEQGQEQEQAQTQAQAQAHAEFDDDADVDRHRHHQRKRELDRGVRRMKHNENHSVAVLEEPSEERNGIDDDGGAERGVDSEAKAEAEADTNTNVDANKKMRRSKRKRFGERKSSFTQDSENLMQAQDTIQHQQQQQDQMKQERETKTESDMEPKTESNRKQMQKQKRTQIRGQDQPQLQTQAQAQAQTLDLNLNQDHLQEETKGKESLGVEQKAKDQPNEGDEDDNNQDDGQDAYNRTGGKRSKKRRASRSMKNPEREDQTDDEDDPDADTTINHKSNKTVEQKRRAWFMKTPEPEEDENSDEDKDEEGEDTNNKQLFFNFSSTWKNYNNVLSMKIRRCYGKGGVRKIYNVCVRKCAKDYILYCTDPQLENESTIYPFCSFVKAKIYSLYYPHNLSLSDMTCPDGRPSTSIRYFNASAHLMMSVKIHNVFFHTMTVLHSYLSISNDMFEDESRRPNIEYVIGGFDEESSHYNDFYERLIIGTNDPERILQLDTETVCLNRLYVGFKFYANIRSQIAYAESSQKLATRIPTMRKALRKAYGLKDSAIVKLKRVCVLSREEKETIRGRIMLNEGELVERIESQGYQVKRIVIVRSATLDRTALSLNPCDALIGVHGAGLANMIFLRPQVLLIEIFPWNFYKSVYKDFAAILDLQYREILLPRSASIATEYSKKARMGLYDSYRLRNVIVDIDVVIHLLNNYKSSSTK